MSTDKKLEQDAQELKGHVEESAGKVFGADDLITRGKADQVAAHAKQAATVAGEAARHIGQRATELAMAKLGELHERLHEAAAAAEDAAREPQPRGTHDKAEGGADKRRHPDA